MRMNLFQFVDALYDKAAECLAKNLTSNIETVAQNKVAKALSELSDQQLRQKGIAREKLNRGSEAYPWKSVDTQLSKEDLEKSLLPLMSASVHKTSMLKPKDKILFAA